MSPKKAKRANELPYIPLGPFQWRIPGIHYRVEYVEFFQGLILGATALSSIPYLTDNLGLPYELAWSCVIIEVFMYMLHGWLGDPVVPLFEFRRLLIDALIVEKLRRIVDGHDAVLHGGEQRVRAAQDGQAPERRLMMRGLGLGDQLAARLAHDGAGLFRPLHDDALDDGLTADGCFLG